MGNAYPEWVNEIRVVGHGYPFNGIARLMSFLEGSSAEDGEWLQA
jgi:hypothetical protein